MNHRKLIELETVKVKHLPKNNSKLFIIFVDTYFKNYRCRMNNYIQTNKFSLKDIHKHPIAYAVVVMAGLLGAFVNWAISSSNKNSDIQNLRYDDCLDDLKQKDSIIQYQNDMMLNYLMKRDSANRAMLEKPVNDLLKTIKK